MELEAAIGHGAKVSKKSDELREEEKKGKLAGLLLFPFFYLTLTLCPHGADGSLMLYHLE